jgi:hypothetical protein
MAATNGQNPYFEPLWSAGASWKYQSGDYASINFWLNSPRSFDRTAGRH